jgi:hypothetical protein
MTTASLGTWEEFGSADRFPLLVRRAQNSNPLIRRPGQAMLLAGLTVGVLAVLLVWLAPTAQESMGLLPFPSHPPTLTGIRA